MEILREETISRGSGGGHRAMALTGLVVVEGRRREPGRRRSTKGVRWRGEFDDR